MATPRKKKLALTITKANIAKVVERFLQNKAMADEAAARQRGDRDALIAYVERHGIVDDKGHQHVEVPGVGTAKRERRVSSVFDEEYAEDWLKANKLWKECTTTITVIDEDTVLAKIYDGTIPEAVGDAMYSEKETFAFKVLEDK